MDDFPKWAKAVAVFFVILQLAILGVVVWAIIQLVPAIVEFIQSNS